MGGVELITFLNIDGLAQAEETAKKILEHTQAIKDLMHGLTPSAVRIAVDLVTEKEADSGN